MTDYQVEMLWKCSSCGHRNLGRYGACQSCSNPKDGSEEWTMPDDTSAAAAVTDEKLLALATAGANWRCTFCGSDQRAADGRCQQCGAQQKQSAPAPVLASPATAKRIVFWRPVIGLWVAGCALMSLVAWLEPLPSLTPATVTQQVWRHTVFIERKQKVSKEGFVEARPPDAEDVQNLGPRFHHDQKVPDGTRSESYTVEVSDGFSTERYTARVECGQDCSTKAQSCRESCTPNKNGFATCKTVCSGGGRSCTTKYCSETKTRQVKKTRAEHRTRQVAVFRDEAREADFFRWSQWEWRPQRSAERQGTAPPLAWPSEDELRPPQPLQPGEEERQRRGFAYEVVFSVPGATLAVASEAELLGLPVGGTHQLQLSHGKVEAIDRPSVRRELVPLVYRPQLWTPLVLLACVPLVFARRWWARAPGSLLRRIHRGKLDKVQARLGFLRHPFGLLVLLCAHVAATSPLDLVAPDRKLDLVHDLVNVKPLLARYLEGEGQVSEWLVLDSAQWAATCRTREAGKPAEDVPCSGQGPLPALGAHVERADFTARVWLTRLPSGARTEGGADLKLMVFDPVSGTWERRYTFAQEEYRLLAAQLGKPLAAVREVYRGKESFTLAVGWPAP